jgi:hypothetical protein
VPLKTRRNGTLYMYAVIALDDSSLDWKEFQRIFLFFIAGSSLVHAYL